MSPRVSTAFRRCLVAWAGLAVALATTLLSVTPAAAAGGSSPATATAIGSVPYGDNTFGSWIHAGPATGSANAALATACNDGQPLYRVRWFSYQPAVATKVVVQGTMDFAIGRDHYFVAAGVAVLTSALSVIDCNVVSGVAAAGPVTIAAGTKVYLAQFVRDNPDPDDFDCNVVCYESTETLTVQKAGNPPANDSVATPTQITSFPATVSADTTLATQGAFDGGYACGTSPQALTRTVWWGFTAAASGSIRPTASGGYVTSVGEVTASGPVFPFNDCNENPFTVTAGKTYVVIVGLPLDYQRDQAGVGGTVTLSVPSGPALAKPDLVVTSVASVPAAPKAGDPVRFRATIKNQGGAATPAGVVHGVSFKVDGVAKTWSDTFHGALAPGASVTVTANGGVAGAATWPATSGAHTVLATVDDINRIPGETSESNNTRSVALSVAALAARPDLVVTGVTWSPVTPVAGSAVRFSATIKNQGAAATPAGVIHGVSFKVDGVAKSWSDTHTSAIPAGGSVTLTATNGPSGSATWSATTGAHTVLATVDDVNRIPGESDETNNALAVSLNVGQPTSLPDLVVTAVSWVPTSPVAGSPVRFTATLKNLGTRSTPRGKVVGVSFRVNGVSTGATYSDTWNTPVPPGGVITVTANGGGSSGRWVPSSAGAIPVVAIVDDINRFPEAREANNGLTAVVSVS